MLVSIIIPVYNSNKTIERSISSVIKSVEMNTKDYEIICIDDGSKDSSLAILKELSKNNRRIKVFSQKNEGAAAARNAGLEIANGSYIAFNDSDDEWSVEHFSELMKIFKMFPDVKCVSANHDIEHQKTYGLKKIAENLFEVNINAQQFKNYFSPQNSMISKEIIEFGIRFNPMMRGSEEFLFYNHILKNFKCLFYNKKISQSILHKFRYGQSGLSGNLKEMEKGELFAIKDAHINLGISNFVFFGAYIVSVFKYIKRIIIVKFRRNQFKGILK